jgi:hypothetical protein
MPGYGFGNRPFGNFPFGDADWCKIVLYDEMQDFVKEQDEEAGGAYLKFVEAMCPSFEFLRRHISRFRTLQSPRQIREDLLVFFAENFGIEIDQAEPLDFRRTRASLAARWNIIKGTVDAYTVLARVHGFEVTVVPLWWDGTEFSEAEPVVFNELSEHTITSPVGGTRYQVRLGHPPVRKSTVSVRVGPILATDDGLEGMTGTDVLSGTIDYGWGYIDMLLNGPHSEAPLATYNSRVGGCPTTAAKCKTHRLRLDVVPGADIAGQSDLTISEAFSRLYGKFEDTRPIHVEFAFDDLEASAILNLGHHFDILSSDEVPADTGVRWEIVLAPTG